LKVYLASNYSSHPEMRQVRELLQLKGFLVTSRWINGEHEVLEGQSHNLNSSFAKDDWDDLEQADIVIWFSRDKTNRGRGGRHVEFGLALAWKKPLYVVGHKENVFHWLPQVKHYNTLESLINEIRNEK